MPTGQAGGMTDSCKSMMPAALTRLRKSTNRKPAQGGR